MTTYDPQAWARSHRARAGAYTKAAERQARQAADCYEAARRQLRKAAELTRNPRLAEVIPPALLERHAADYTRLGDGMLRSSFYSTEMAATYRKLGASWAAHGKGTS